MVSGMARMHRRVTSPRRPNAAPPHWISLWAVALLWTVLSILPDALIFGRRIILTNSAPKVDAVRAYRVVGQGFDCAGAWPDTTLQRCVNAAGDARIKSASGQIRFVFLPVSWSRTQPQSHAWNWTATDRALTQARRQALTPVLVLHSVPEWVRARAQAWDRDNPATLAAYPHAAAHFAAAVAQRYGRQVDYYQLDTLANAALDAFPFAVNPVRYGQMAAAASTAMRRVDPALHLMSAPIMPVKAQTEAFYPPRAWMQRLLSTPARNALDVIAWRPRWTESPNAASPEVAAVRLTLFARPLPAPMPGAPAHWLWTRPVPGADVPATSRARDAMILTGSPPAPVPAQRASVRARDAGSGRRPDARRIGKTWLGLALLLFVAAASWAKTVPLVHHWGRAASAPPQGSAARWSQDLLYLAGAGGALAWPFLVADWLAAAGAILLLACLAVVRPVLIWTLALGALPFDHVHANLVTPLWRHALALSASQILVLALLPACSLQWRAWFPVRLRRRHGLILWLLLGWLLLWVLSLPQWPAESRWHVSWEQDAYPWALALLTLGFGFKARTLRQGLTALALGAGLFACAALGQWITAPWEAASTLTLQRLSGLTFSPNHAAMILERGLWLCLALASLARTPCRRSFWVVWTGAVVLALLLTQSRGALALGGPAALAGWVLDARRRRHAGPRRAFPQPVRWLLCLLLAGGLAWTALQFNFGARVQDTLPILARWHIWHHAWPLAQGWFGQGADGFYWRAASALPFAAFVSPDLVHPHNVWLETLIRWGAVGLLWMIVLLAWTGLRLRPAGPTAPVRALPRGAALALCAGLMHAQVDAFWRWPDIAAMNLWLFLFIATRTKPSR